MCLLKKKKTMNKFCEECGSKLSAGDKFCIECGAKVEAADFDNNTSNKLDNNLIFSFFNEKHTEFNFDADDGYLGIFFTNYAKLEQKFGKSGFENLKFIISEYLEFYKQLGIYYLVLDASDNYISNPNATNWKQHVQLLQKAIKRIKIKLKREINFILIFGGNEIIPMPIFDNPVEGSSDSDVDTDLPYSTLSIKNPLQNSEACTPRLPVGRIPTGTDTRIEDLQTILENTLNGLNYFSTEKTFGLSAFNWQKVSDLINRKVCKTDLFVSPAITIQNVNNYYSTDCSLHYFNLHGSNSAPEWYGQKENNYPVAFSPNIIATNKVLNIIGVEACYGARFIGLKNSESILLTALATKTVSFVGSSRIAWGPSAPPMNLADIVIHDFLDLMQKGIPAGVAHLKARMNAFENSCATDPATSLLTLMEFNLFGDPVFAIPEDNDLKNKALKTNAVDGDTIIEISDAETQESRKPTFAINSIYSTVRQAVDFRQQQIIDLINKVIWNKYPEFKGITPKFSQYNFEGKLFKSLVYKKEMQLFNQFLHVNTNNNGEILSELWSK